jgi:hypothetical protein
MLVTILRRVAHIPVQSVHRAATIGQTFMPARLGNCFRRWWRFRYPKLTLMNKLGSIVFAAGLAPLSAGAQAMPLAPIDASNGAVIIQVAQGCGPGGHRAPSATAGRSTTARPVGTPAPTAFTASAITRRLFLAELRRGYIPRVNFMRTGWFAQRCRFTPVLHGAGSRRSRSIRCWRPRAQVAGELRPPKR